MMMLMRYVSHALQTPEDDDQSDKAHELKQALLTAVDKARREERTELLKRVRLLEESKLTWEENDRAQQEKIANLTNEIVILKSANRNAVAERIRSELEKQRVTAEMDKVNLELGLIKAKVVELEAKNGELTESVIASSALEYELDAKMITMEKKMRKTEENLARKNLECNELNIKLNEAVEKTKKCEQNAVDPS
ncbi:hypothetical protein PRIPAC_92568 [Pristionchus pacificus]|uniref:Uncharacterized protein n=1 Tax=Pristionchus pacificus TaxID=54126 RepID=A0A2A6BBC0_PRIPA|nr:hypothetical protein PRIPAC_92568 [Pristionchus pacificus]|eukprot:PDM63179.1 hypothetical protein PRIPAC_50394 [Pristionchus pacificus]